MIAHEAKADVDEAAAGFAASGAKIAVICSTDKRYATAVAELAPKLKAAGARSVVLAGNPGPVRGGLSRRRRRPVHLPALQRPGNRCGPSFVRKRRSHERHPELRAKSPSRISTPQGGAAAHAGSAAGRMADRGRHRDQAGLHRRRSCGMRASRHVPGLSAVRSRSLQFHVCDAALDGAAIRRILHRRGVQRLLQAQHGDGSEGPQHRLRPADPSRLRQRQSARARRRRHGGCGDRLHPRHAHSVRRPAARSDQRLDDDERRRAADPGDVCHRRRGTGRCRRRS